MSYSSTVLIVSLFFVAANFLLQKKKNHGLFGLGIHIPLPERSGSGITHKDVRRLKVLEEILTFSLRINTALHIVQLLAPL